MTIFYDNAEQNVFDRVDTNPQPPPPTDPYKVKKIYNLFCSQDSSFLPLNLGLIKIPQTPHKKEEHRPPVVFPVIVFRRVSSKFRLPPPQPRPNPYTLFGINLSNFPTQNFLFLFFFFFDTNFLLPPLV